ncbi:umbelliferone 6-dimethylallyltransferase, chloroplastic-like isoform X2 [Apium graveolens]|uniref:umbelliferone 6-dimethylallyltransferase, chloroplastic-like isoform X2 n=1 Tax=Apium graveolens TaxID=4045 RepID=UPI003D7BE521
MQALLPFSCASIYTSGINQVFDMDMDKLPLLRWKTNAAMTSFSMGGLLGLTMLPAAFYHIQDIPDVEGDKAFGIMTFSVKYGKQKASLFSLSIYSANCL